MKPEYTAEFRFYAELNDFLAPEQRRRTLSYLFGGHPGIKDPIEVFGVPHTEVELIVIDGQPVGFDYQLQTGDRVAVYPVFKSLDSAAWPALRAKPWPLSPLYPGRKSGQACQTHAPAGFRQPLSQRQPGSRAGTDRGKRAAHHIDP